MRAADRAWCVGVAAAQLGPAVQLTRQAHRRLRGADSREDAVERLHTIGMQLRLTQQPVHHRLLYTIPKNAVERMRDNRQAALLVYQLNAALDAQPRRD